jgi:Fe-Mn family superoxide dismutase
MEHQMPELPYPKDALAPHMSAETLEYHYGKHHKAYVDKLNELIRNTKFEYMPLLEIVLSSDDKVFLNAAQAWNHDFFWKCLSPNGGGTPDGEIGKMINRKWGNFDDFKAEFSTMAKENFGSGWTWLALNKSDELEIFNTSNAQTPKKYGMKAILTIDVWEHAYYIDYRNDRENFIEAYWNIVNWEFANKNLE